MKSEHRHELETNALAKRLAVVVERVRPFTPGIIVVAVVGLLGMIGFSYFSSESAAKQSETWNSFNQSVEGLIPNMDGLKQTAEENAGTPTQLLANAAWADGQVWMASRAYIQSRPAALEAANRARTAYESILQSTDNPQLINRAQLGLGRVYELRNEPDKAREHYLAVTGGFADFAKQRAEALAEPKTKEAWEWLATAEAPRRAAPTGAGTPGKRPDFTAGDLDIPGGEKTPSGDTATPTTDDLLKGFLPDEGKDTKDRYQTGYDKAKSDAPAK
jgi:predicted negative regulator of RcsB-dependent stress response